MGEFRGYDVAKLMLKKAQEWLSYVENDAKSYGIVSKTPVFTYWYLYIYMHIWNICMYSMYTVCMPMGIFPQL